MGANGVVGSIGNSYTPRPFASSDIMHIAGPAYLHYIACPMQRSSLLADVGHRVRALREARGLTQRALAARSGVSPRYLAQLEAGDANMSVERLADLAQALDTTLGALVDPASARAGARPRSQEAQSLRAAVDGLLDGRDLGELKEVRRWLDARFARR